MNRLILIGAGGHSKVIQDIIAENYNLKLFAILDDAFYNTKKLNGIVYSNRSFLSDIQKEDFLFCIAIGNNSIRKKLVNELQIPMYQYVTLVHSSAIVSESAIIGNGTVVMPNAVVNADATIGNHCIINSGAVIEHDNTLDHYVHVSPNATLSGTVSVGEGSHIGSGAVIIPGKSIGNWSIIGAGAVIINDIGDEVTAVGVPGKVLK